MEADGFAYLASLGNKNYFIRLTKEGLLKSYTGKDVPAACVGDSYADGEADHEGNMYFINADQSSFTYISKDFKTIKKIQIPAGTDIDAAYVTNGLIYLYSNGKIYGYTI